MQLKTDFDVENTNSGIRIKHELWPLGEIDLKKGKFPCCVVWTPLPVVSWLAPFIGHLGICREDGTVIDFSGSNFLNVDDFAFGSVARYLQLEREQERYKHLQNGTGVSWDDAILSSMHHFEHKSYNLFTCNCHSFVANCLNRLCYGGSGNWNIISIATLILFKGRWVDSMSILRSFSPFVVVACLGIFMVGWPFLIGLLSFAILLITWFLLGTYCFKSLLEC